MSSRAREIEWIITKIQSRYDSQQLASIREALENPRFDGVAASKAKAIAQRHFEKLNN